MATRHSPREGSDGRIPQNHRYTDRNRIFSSTTTNHYKNKLAQIGIEKDLREILERKKIDKEQAENCQNVSGNDLNDSDQASKRKVRFDEKPVRIRRSKSFTSGVTKTSELSPSSPNTFNKERKNSHNQNHWKHDKSQRPNFVDLHNPTNIKVEIETDSGTRKCFVDVDTPISGVKCDLKNSRHILKNTENKTKADQQADHNENKIERTRGAGHSRGGQRRSFHKKRAENNESTSGKNIEKSISEKL